LNGIVKISIKPNVAWSSSAACKTRNTELIMVNSSRRVQIPRIIAKTIVLVFTKACFVYLFDKIFEKLKILM